MPTNREIAEQKQADKFRRAGFKPDGITPLDASDRDDQPGNETDEERQERERQEEEDRQGGGGDGDLRTQVQQLQSQLAALQGRVAPAQRDADSFKQLWQTEKDARAREAQQLQEQIDALQTQLSEREETVDITSFLTDDEKKDIDPVVLSAIEKIAKGIAKQTAPKPVNVRGETLAVLEEREKKAVNDHRSKVMNDPTRGLHQLAQLAYDPAFIAWSKEEDNDVESVVTSLLNAKSTEEVDRYAKIVAKRITSFKTRDKGEPAPNARTSMGQHMRRGEKPQMTEAERSAKFNEAKNLSRSRNPADRQKAQQILNSL